MKTSILVGVLSSTAALVNAQATFNPSTGTFTCPPGKSAFCASDSLVSNIIIRCTGTVGHPGNCNDNLAGIPPRGVKVFAPCWECSPTSGDAACSYAGTVYPDSGANFTVAQGNATCNSTTTTSSNSTSTSPAAAVSTASDSSMSTTLGTNTVLSASGGYASASFLNQAGAAGGAVTSTTTVQSTTVATLAMPSSVPVAPGSGGYGYSNSTESASGAAGASATPLGTGSPTQTIVGGNGGSGTSGTISPIATFAGAAGSLSTARQVNVAIAVAIFIVAWWFH